MNDIYNLKKPISVFWEPTEYCNLQCIHCYTNSSPQKKLSISLTRAKEIIDLLYQEGIYAIGLGGGEPLMLPFLCELIRYVNLKGMQISISTNGILLTQEYLKDLKDAGLKILQVSVDGLKETHEKIRGKGTFYNLFKKINDAQNLGFGVRVGYTVNSINYNEIEEFINYSKEHGVHVINFFRYMPYHEGSEYLSLSAMQLLKAAEILLKHRANNIYGEGKDRFYITFEPLSFFSFLLDKNDITKTACTAGRSKFVITSNEDISICNYIMNKIGNVAEGMEELWKKITEECKEINRIPEECEKCEYSEVCRGGCRGFSYAYYGIYEKKDKGCFRELVNER